MKKILVKKSSKPTLLPSNIDADGSPIGREHLDEHSYPEQTEWGKEVSTICKDCGSSHPNIECPPSLSK